MSLPAIDLLDEEIESAYARLESIEAELARRSLISFVEKAWSIIEPSTPFVHNWHIDVLCSELEAISRGEVTREIINVPPGTMKTLLILVFFPAWEWATDASKRYLTISYSASRTIDSNVKLRDIITSEWYQKHFKVELKGDQNAKQRYDTTAGGWCIASSVGGLGTGVHPDRILIDDPMSADDARSDTIRDGVNDWIRRTLSSRGVSRDAAVILDMQRLHVSDTTGFFLAKAASAWRHVCLPMRYEAKREDEPEWKPDPLDPRRTPGELLWPELFTERKVRQLELDLGPYGTAGQLQLRPSPEGGGLFKRSWFKIVDALPTKIKRRSRGWDTAGTENDGDWTVGVRLSEDYDGNYYIEDVTREQLGPSGVDAILLETSKLDGRHTGIFEEKEPGGSGLAVINAHTKQLKGYDYQGVNISGDKVTRARPFRAQVEAGNVSLLRAPWNEAYLSELSFFPVGEHDDQVDASSAAFNGLLTLPERKLTGVFGR